MGKLSDIFGIPEEELDKIADEQAASGDFADIPDKTWVLAEVLKATGKTSKADNLCTDMEYKVLAVSSKAAPGNYGSPHVWDNGALLNVPKVEDLTGQPDEAIKAYRSKVGRFVHRVRAHGGDPEAWMVESADLLPTSSLVGSRLLLKLRTLPAGSTYQDGTGATQTRNRTKYEIMQVEAMSADLLAKHGLEAPSTPF